MRSQRLTNEVQRRVEEAERRMAELEERVNRQFNVSYGAIKMPRFKLPEITRELLKPGKGFFRRIWCWWFEHDWHIMTGEEPKLRVERCMRCGCMVNAEGGWNPMMSVKELMSDPILTRGISKTFDKIWKDYEKYGDAVTTVRYEKTTFGRRRSVAQR